MVMGGGARVPRAHRTRASTEGRAARAVQMTRPETKVHRMSWNAPERCFTHPTCGYGWSMQ